ncbi:uptake of enterobactin [Alcanivorax xiamenensis]|uniref:Biopolymer transport protein ExbD n=1 Tax=Alcanivorax xiamenensis TaxID=1177156 RepID=A0ABQ6YB39_9GAMM|nr:MULTISPECIES: TonB system transport protein ExbD [Alcanivorax]KAF0807163.1 uptake of enterobactin [Alcanivorax xiamenensis]
MAFKLQGDDASELPDNHDINVTPFIDVMLVLLIIFMVAAPLATVSVPVDLPAAVAEPRPEEPKPLYLSVQSDLTLTLGQDQVVTLDTLVPALRDALPDQEQRILLRADKSVPYGELMRVMNRLSEAGYLKIALIGADKPADSTP